MKKFTALKDCQLNGSPVKAGEVVELNDKVAATLNQKLFAEVTKQDDAADAEKAAAEAKAAEEKAAEAKAKAAAEAKAKAAAEAKAKAEADKAGKPKK